MTSDNLEQPPPRASEKHLLELVESVSIQGNVLTQTQGRGHLAMELAQADEVQVDCWFIDQYQANLAGQLCNDRANIICQPDPPTTAYDWAFLPLGRNGETEFVRETLQSFFERLSTNGQMWVAVDNPQDRWVRQQLDRFDLQIQTERVPTAIAYCCRKRGPLNKRKNYGCEFVYRDRGRLIKAYSRPGVFSHRRIDPGARHLIDAMQLDAGDRILDMGCGAGTVSLAAAAVSSANLVHAIDCNARAIECTERGKTLNELTNVTTQLTAGGELHEPSTFDVFLGNPPYYANLSIAGLFLDTAQRALRVGGRAYFVSKHAEWYSEALPEFFTAIEIWPVKGYVIASGIRI